MARGSKAMSQLRKFLDQNHWQYLQGESGLLKGLVAGEKTQWHWVARANDDGRFLMFQAFCPVNVCAERLTEVAEYLTRANWGMYFGNFEMDWSDGQVSFRTSIPIAASGVAVKAVEHLVFASWAMMDRYVPGLLTVALGNVTPEQAVKAAESPDAPAPPLPEPDGIRQSPEVTENRRGRIGRLFQSDN